VDLRHFAFYAFAGRSGVERWSRKTEVVFFLFLSSVHSIIWVLSTCKYETIIYF